MKDRRYRNRLVARVVFAGAILVLAGCIAPIGVENVPTQKAYAQVEANALRTGKPSADTMAILHRNQLDHLVSDSTDEAVRQLHAKAVATGERGLLFALAELSYMAGDRFSRIRKQSDARDYYLGSAVYAWLFLFGEGLDAPPTAFDRRFRQACDFYNYGLGLAFVEKGDNDCAVRLESIRRRLPVGQIDLQVDAGRLEVPLAHFDQILLADRFRVRGLSVRNRDAGVGTPLICVHPLNTEFDARTSIPVTAFLRGPLTLAELTTDRSACLLELYPSFNDITVDVGGARVPLEIDLTTYLAYTLNQSKLWDLGPLQFLVPAEHAHSQLIMNQPYHPNRIPVVFVHGTFSSPITWAEMANALTADPVLRRRYQAWTFIYGSGNPLVYSMRDLRTALTAKIKELDPQGTNPMLQQMVVIGHSQGGLLAKSVAIDTGDRLWRKFSASPLEDLDIPETQRAKLRSLLFIEPLPFVRRVVFIATPHRGSYHLSGSFVRSLGQRFVTLPGEMVKDGSEMLKLTKGAEAEGFLEGKMPTSLDGMSPQNPALLAMAEISVAPSIAVHSIVAVEDDSDPAKGGDGIVSYESAHVEYASSEFIVRSYHTCLDNPATIEEVRRIMHLHLKELPPVKP